MRPHVIVNVAVSADGKLSTRERRQVKISGYKDFERVDELKASCDAVMVGIGTVLADNPSLTIKSADRIATRVANGLCEHPVRIVIDSNARTPPESKVLHKGSGKRIIAVSESAEEGKVSSLARYADIIKAGDRMVDLSLLMDELGKCSIRSVMVEGGGTLIWGLLSAGLVDELFVFIGKIVIGGRDSPTLADGTGFINEVDFRRLDLINTEVSEEGVLIHWKVIN